MPHRLVPNGPQHGWKRAYFEDLAAAEAAGNATPKLLDTIAAKNNVEMLGPVPDNYLQAGATPEIPI